MVKNEKYTDDRFRIASEEAIYEALNGGGGKMGLGGIVTQPQATQYYGVEVGKGDIILKFDNVYGGKNSGNYAEAVIKMMNDKGIDIDGYDLARQLNVSQPMVLVLHVKDGSDKVDATDKKLDEVIADAVKGVKERGLSDKEENLLQTVSMAFKESGRDDLPEDKKHLAYTPQEKETILKLFSTLKEKGAVDKGSVSDIIKSVGGLSEDKAKEIQNKVNEL